MEKFRSEQLERNEKFQELSGIFGENFNKKKTIKIEKDIDKDNNSVENEGQNIFWTELFNPETKESIEAKVYMPKNGKAENMIIVSPGYRGDFVMQENEYGKDFASNKRGIIFLRHNSLRIKGSDMDNYVHCLEKKDYAEKENQNYLGKEDDFDFLKADDEVLTALKALSENIKKIDIIGHSWGGRIALNSLLKLKKEGISGRDLLERVDNLILLGAWLETREKIIESFKTFFESEEKEGYFKNMDAGKIVNQIIQSGKKLKEIKADDLPSDLRIVGIHSVSDEDIDLEGEIFEFFKKIKSHPNKGSIILKDLKGLLPDKIGDRKSEIHDYNLSQVRDWIKLAIKKGDN
jgi:hypothetical protein